MNGEVAASEATGAPFAPFDPHASWVSTVRTVITAVADGYGLHVAGEQRDLGGTFKRNVLIRAEHAALPECTEYVVHVHRPFIAPARVAAVHGAVRALARSNLPVVQPLATTAGETLLMIEGHVVDVEPYVRSDAITDSWPRFTAAA